MSDPAIRAVALGKIFRVWRHPSDMLKEVLSGRRRHSEFEALHDVSFDLPRGSVVGIMGRNGAGKSTLLRIIAGTLDASSGSVSSAGRVSAILELGTGFHPEYSGRENVYLGGLCLGLTRAEIASRFAEIVSFAELEEFIDQPFRTYSSGMQARLTFAVATAVDPDILIIDEALAVGDARFQLKSFDRVRQFRRQGKSILLVSHDINQVVSICDHAILLERGRVFAQGQPCLVGNVYHELLFGSSTAGLAPLVALDARGAAPGSRPHEVDPPAAAVELSLESPLGSGKASDTKPDADPALFQCNGLQVTERADVVPTSNLSITTGQTDETHIGKPAPFEQPSPIAFEGAASENIDREHRYGDGAVRIVDFFIREAKGAKLLTIKSLQAYEFMIHLEAVTDVTRLGVGILVRTPRGIEVFGANTFLLPECPTRDMRRGERLHVRVPFVANLGHGTYFASAVVANSNSVKHDARFDALQFAVEQTPFHDASLANLNPQFIYEAPEDIQEPQRRFRGSRS